MPDREIEVSAAPEDFASMTVQTSQSYDALPYVSLPFPRTQPSHLAAIGCMFAFEAVPIGKARILELGCAAGGNIIPLAARHPGAKIVGVDVSGVQITAGHSRISYLGLSNIDLTCRSLTDVDAGDGSFDYIICHGVYSWVSAPMREAILRVCRDRLSPRGIAMVSYNVLPGWRLMQVLRDCLLSFAGESDPRRRATEARELLEMLSRTSPDKGAYRLALQVGAERLGKSTDDYIVHEFLDETNEPCTFQDFVAASARHGLAYLAESELSSMIATNYPEEMTRMIRKVARDRLFATEQFIDMASGRLFRHSLLVGSEHVPMIDRRLSNERVEAMHFIGSPDLSLAVDENGGGVLISSTGTRVSFGTAPLTDALARFMAVFPGSSTVDDLMPALPVGLRNFEGRALLREAMLKLVLAGLANASTEPVLAAAAAGAKPLACPLVRADASRGEPMTANLRHEPVELDTLAQHVLPLLDGSRDVEEVKATILQRLSEGRLVSSRNDFDGDPNSQTRRIADRVDGLFSRFARAGLLRVHDQ
jgi:predicted O-methyltransferase YrrM